MGEGGTNERTDLMCDYYYQPLYLTLCVTLDDAPPLTLISSAPRCVYQKVNKQFETKAALESECLINRATIKVRVESSKQGKRQSGGPKKAKRTLQERLVNTQNWMMNRDETTRRRTEGR